LAFACIAFVLATCGRTSLLPPWCDIAIEPAALDFGQVLPGDSATREIRIVNRGGGECKLTNIGTSPTTDEYFSLSAPSSLLLASEVEATLTVTFKPLNASIPIDHSGEVTFDIDSGSVPRASVPLRGVVQTDCRLGIAPSSLDFGHVAIDTSQDLSVRLVNSGTTSCEVANIVLGPSTDSEFHLGATADPFTLDPGDTRSLSVSFAPKDLAPPHHRTGTLLFATTDSSQPVVTVALSADIDIGCNVSWSPTSIDFGSLRLNNKADRQVTLANDGSDTCYLSGIGLAPDSHPDFTLLSTETTLAVTAGARPAIGVRFTAADSSTPHHKTGTLVFQTGNQRNPSAKVPLSADVDTVCVDASRWIYTLDQSAILARFDPNTLTFTDIATLKCPNRPIFNSMAVDQNAVAWVGDQDGNLFKVDVSTGACEGTNFKGGPAGLMSFGMGFVFDPSTGLDTLYIAGGSSLLFDLANPPTLATVSFPSLAVTKVGVVEEGYSEMTGTGDGQLWGFIPNFASSTNRAVLVRLDPNSGATLESYPYTSLTGGGAWAMKFWGGYFWIFLDTAVYKAKRETPETILTAIADTRRSPILGAGVSTCAPVQ
jgi:hypothetical protein